MNYRLSPFCDHAKTSLIRMAWPMLRSLSPQGGAAVALRSDRLCSEIMLENCGVEESNWRDATSIQPHFGIFKTPCYAGGSREMELASRSSV